MMLNAQVAQIWQLSQKTPKKHHKHILADHKLKLHKITEELKAVYLPFCMNICQWESCVESGCCICSQSIKNNNTLTIPSVVCNCLNTTKRAFCINIWQWIHHFTQKSNKESAEWTAAGESYPKWPKMQTSAGKVLASVFWNVQGILFIDYLEKGRTINSEYHIALLVHLKEKITKKTATKEEAKNALLPRQCTCHKSMAKQCELHFELFLHPPYSPDLGPSNCWLFADLKRTLQGKRFSSNEEVILESKASFEAKNKSFYKKGIELLEKHWNQCMTLERDYVDE